MPRFPKSQDYPFLGLSAYRWYRWIIFGQKCLPEPFMYFMTRRIADIRRHIDKRGREAIESNLRLILGGDTPKKIIRKHTRRVFYQTAAYICEFLGIKRFASRWRRGLGWKLYNIESINRAQAEGRGVLVLSAHFSNWEISAAMLATFDKEVYVTSLEHEDPRITELFNEVRRIWGYNHMPIKQSVKLSMEAMRSGKIVCYLGDRAFAAAGTVKVTFFGKQVSFPTTPVKMALKTNAAIITGFNFRKGRNFFHLKVGEAIEPLQGVAFDENVRHVVQEYARRLENAVREDPSQWVCFMPIGEEERAVWT